MQIGQLVLLRNNKELYEGKVIQILDEDLKIELKNGEIIFRKFWEVAKSKNEQN